mgnify:CR=1 FL=1
MPRLRAGRLAPGLAVGRAPDHFGAAALRAATRAHLRELGLTGASAVPADFTYYDQVLQVTATLGAAPARFRDLLDADGALDIEGYFTLARGEGARPALEMTKWLDSNYHYLVPEIDASTPIDYVDTADGADDVPTARTFTHTEGHSKPELGVSVSGGGAVDRSHGSAT